MLPGVLLKAAHLLFCADRLLCETLCTQREKGRYTTNARGIIASATKLPGVSFWPLVRPGINIHDPDWSQTCLQFSLYYLRGCCGQVVAEEKAGEAVDAPPGILTFLSDVDGVSMRSSSLTVICK